MMQFSKMQISFPSLLSFYCIVFSFLHNTPICIDVLLLSAGLLTRDPRVHERKKPGQAGARKKYTWSVITSIAIALSGIDNSSI